MLLIILYIIIHTIIGTITHKCFSENDKTYNEWSFLTILFAPIMFIIALIIYPSFFFGWMLPKKKPREVVPGTYNGYLWGEVVEARGSKGIVIDYSGMNLIKVLWMNSSVSEFVDVSEITSTQKPSELAEELALFKQSNELLAKADALVKEAGELKMKAIKKRSNLIYKP